MNTWFRKDRTLAFRKFANPEAKLSFHQIKTKKQQSQKGHKPPSPSRLCLFYYSAIGFQYHRNMFIVNLLLPIVLKVHSNLNQTPTFKFESSISPISHYSFLFSLRFLTDYCHITEKESYRRAGRAFRFPNGGLWYKSSPAVQQFIIALFPMQN